MIAHIFPPAEKISSLYIIDAHIQRMRYRGEDPKILAMHMQQYDDLNIASNERRIFIEVTRVGDLSLATYRGIKIFPYYFDPRIGCSCFKECGNPAVLGYISDNSKVRIKFACQAHIKLAEMLSRMAE
jgi:hypothetical protein